MGTWVLINGTWYNVPPTPRFRTIQVCPKDVGRVRRIGVLTSSAESDHEGQSSVAAF